MEFHNIYIPNEIINIIYKSLKFNDKNNFTKVNKFMIKNYHKKTQMYSLELYLNNDYLTFYNLIYKYDYEKEDLEFLKYVCFEAMRYLNVGDYIYLDYRYIFELLYNYDVINKYMIKKNCPYFYKCNYQYIIKSIVKNNRNKTIENINKSPCHLCYYSR